MHYKEALKQTACGVFFLLNIHFSARITNTTWQYSWRKPFSRKIGLKHYEVVRTWSSLWRCAGMFAPSLSDIYKFRHKICASRTARMREKCSLTFKFSDKLLSHCIKNSHYVLTNISSQNLFLPHPHSFRVDVSPDRCRPSFGCLALSSAPNPNPTHF